MPKQLTVVIADVIVSDDGDGGSQVLHHKHGGVTIAAA
jgi:hypothetical protein